MNKLAKDIALTCLKIGAIRLNPKVPFTWASGLKMPVYNDNRLLLGIPEIRQTISKGFSQVIAENNLKWDCIAATATSGIPHATTLADNLNAPLIYVRSQKKQHGRAKRIEGLYTSGDNTILIEDLISTGGSALDAVHALRNEGLHVSACLAIFTYEFLDAKQSFEDNNCPHFVLLKFSELLELAESEQYITTDEIKLLNEWRESPVDWAKKHGISS